MSGFSQTIVQPAATSRGFGKSSTTTLVEMFPASSIHSGQLTDDERVQAGRDLLQDGVVMGSGGYYGFNQPFSRDFQNNGAPNLADVVSGGPGGQPATPYVPNPTPPGPGDTSPLNKPAPPSTDFPGTSNNSFPGSGGGHQANPLDTSAAIAGQTIGEFISGRSYAGSDSV